MDNKTSKLTAESEKFFELFRKVRSEIETKEDDGKPYYNFPYAIQLTFDKYISSLSLPSVEQTENKELKKSLFQANVNVDSLTMQLEAKEKQEHEAIDLLRSFISIAQREGKETNWTAVESRCRTILFFRTNLLSSPLPVEQKTEVKEVDDCEFIECTTCEMNVTREECSMCNCTQKQTAKFSLSPQVKQEDVKCGFEQWIEQEIKDDFGDNIIKVEALNLYLSGYRKFQPVTEVKSDAIEFAEWMLEINTKKAGDTVWRVDESVNMSGTNKNMKFFTTLELYQLFTSQSIHKETKTDK